MKSNNLILRYLNTTVDRLSLVIRHLDNILDQTKGAQEDNRIAKEWHPETSKDLDLLENYVDTITSEINSIRQRIKVIREDVNLPQ